MFSKTYIKFLTNLIITRNYLLCVQKVFLDYYGYKIQSRQKVTKQYKNGKLIDSSTTTETCRMVHCDFGWGGSCNGYYVDGIFKLNSDKNDYDSPWLGVKDTNFNHHMRIITYK